MDQTTSWPGSGGTRFSSISRRTWAAQCHDNTTGLYLGLDGFSPNTLTEIVNTGPDVTIEAVEQTKDLLLLYIFYTYIADTHANIYCTHLGFVKREGKASLERNTSGMYWSFFRRNRECLITKARRYVCRLFL